MVLYGMFEPNSVFVPMHHILFVSNVWLCQISDQQSKSLSHCLTHKVRLLSKIKSDGLTSISSFLKLKNEPDYNLLTQALPLDTHKSTVKVIKLNYSMCKMLFFSLPEARVFLR